MTFRKIINFLKVYLSYHWSRITRKPIHSGMPVALSFEPTTACNLRCPECPSGLRSFTRTTGNLKADFFRETIDQLFKELTTLTFYFQGEPYINPSFLDMVAYARQKGIYTITSTNGHFLDDANCKKTIESGLDRLIISIDGTTQEVYEQYRKAGTLSTVIAGTKNMIAWKKKLKSKTPHIIFQFLVVKPNEHQIPEVKAWAMELGVDDLKLKTAQIYDYKNGNPLIPDLEEFSRYKMQKDGTYQLKNPLLDQCWRLWHACVITWDGMVVPCCFDKDAQHSFGDLKQQSFVEVWRDNKASAFRKNILKGRSTIDICTNCTEGCTVWS